MPSICEGVEREAGVDDAGPRSPNAMCILRVEGRVTDYRGENLGGRVITVCGPACFVSTTERDGRFSVDVRSFINLSIYSLQVHGRPAHASVYVGLPAPVDGVLRFAAPLAIPLYAAQSAPIPEASTAGTFTAGEVSVTVPAGATMEFDVEDAELGELGRRVRSVPIPPERRPSWAATMGVVGMWALAPFGLRSNRPFGIRVANTARLPAGSSVEFVALGAEPFLPPVNAGQPVPVGTGTVTPDGMFIATDAGQGPTFVSWIAIRPRR